MLHLFHSFWQQYLLSMQATENKILYSDPMSCDTGFPCNTTSLSGASCFGSEVGVILVEGVLRDDA